jgi:hypothetical protein
MAPTRTGGLDVQRHFCPCFFGFRFFVGVAAASPGWAADCNLKLYTSLDLQSDAAPIFGVKIGEKTYRMGLNNRSSNSMMSKPLADELHLRQSAIRDAYFMLGSEEIRQYAVVPSLQLGSVILENAKIAVVPNWQDTNIVGWFGADFLQRLDIEFDFAHKKVNLFSPDHCPGQVVYWTDSYTSVPYVHGKWGNVVLKQKSTAKSLRARSRQTVL